MSEEKPKNRLLTSELDFEGLDDMLASPRISDKPDPLSDLVFDVPKEFVRKQETPDPQVVTALPPVRKVIIPAKFVEPPRMSPRKKIVVAPVQQDRFTLYAVAIVIVALLTVSFGIYFTRLGERNSAGLSYVVLPEIIVNIDGMVARVQATIQVNDADQGWLQDNKKTLGEDFAKKFATLNIEDLRNSKGIADAQSELKDLLNRDLNTDKVEAVLLTDLVIQDQG